MRYHLFYVNHAPSLREEFGGGSVLVTDSTESLSDLSVAF